MRWRMLLTVLTLIAAACGGGSSTSTLAPGTLVTGEDNVVAALRTGCEAGDYVMCDVLFFAAPFDSELEAFADSCGGRNEGGLYCAEVYEVDIDLAALTTQCTGGDMLACDQLLMYSPAGSTEEDIGSTCGGKGRQSRTCVVDHGLITR